VYTNRAKIGVISWVPATRPAGTWWQSSEQEKEFLTESVGFLFEWLFNSGRWTSSPDGYVQRGSTAAWRDVKISTPSLERLGEAPSYRII
jgi:hypothetical protein